MFETEGLVLSRRKIDESNCYLTLFSRALGKVQIYAKNANNPKSPLNKGAQPFVYGTFTVAGTKSFRLTSVEITESFYSLRTDLLKLSYASYICELSDKVLKDNENNHALYALLIKSMYIINKTEGYDEKLKLYFEINLLISLGLLPELNKCTACRTKDDLHFFSVNQGGVVCTKCNTPEMSSFKPHDMVIKLFHYGANVDMKNFLNKDINSLLIEKLDIIINSYIEYHLGINMKNLKRFLKIYK